MKLSMEVAPAGSSDHFQGWGNKGKILDLLKVRPLEKGHVG